MNKKIIFKTKSYILGLFLSLSCILSAFAQVGPIKLSWDTQVGCEEFGNDSGRKEILLSEITPRDCLLICAGMPVKYKLTGTGLGTGFTTTWSVIGGTVTSQTNSNCNVTWGAVGEAYLTFTITLASGVVVNNSICVNIKPKPTAYFTLFPFTPDTEIRGDLNGCFGQTINFTNFSVSGNSQVIYNSFWDFGDNSPTSTEMNPSHIYQSAGYYRISLTITNTCGCKTEVSRMILIGQRGFDIRTPSVVCEGQIDDYYTDLINCTSQTTWSVIGGTVIQNVTDSKHATILWNNPPASGFGTVTFDPSSCNVACPLTTSIKVPIISRIGTIIGDNSICTGEQASYQLPQWPSTDFEWKVIHNGQINPSTVQIVTSDMRNEVFIKGLSDTATVPGFPGGQITLVCYYTNTFLHCGGTATYTINIAKTVDISGASNACLNNPIIYTTIGGTLVNWSLKRATGQTIAIANSTGTNSIIIPFNSPTFTAGNYILSVSGNDYCTTPITISVNAPPAIPVISNTPSVTEPLLSQFNSVCPSASYTYRISNPVAGIEYVWAVADGNFIGSNIGTEVNINFNASITQSISVYAKGITPSCNSTTLTVPIAMVTLTEANAGINNAASGPNMVCSSSTATYTTPYTGADSYLWSIQPSSLGSVSSGQGTNQVVVQWNNATQPSGSIANLRLTITKCSLALTVIQKPVTILNAPSFTVNSNIDPMCSGGLITFSLATPNAFLTPLAQVTWTVLNENNVVIPLGITFGTASLTTSGTILNPGLSNTIRTVTATISLPASSGCSGTYLATKAITVTPGPGANLTFTGGNTFCTTSNPVVPITTVLTATSTTTGVTYAWFRNGNLIAGIPNTTATLSAAVTSANGAGTYTVVVTKNGCSTTSNGVTIASFCNPEVDCSLPLSAATLTSNYVCSSTTINIPTLTFTGNTTVTPNSQNITVSGPVSILNPTLSSTASSSTYSFSVTTAGDYTATYKVVTSNGSGGFCKLIRNATVTVPYIPKFITQVTCSGTQYNIQLVDNSSILNTVTNLNYQYAVSSDGGTTFTPLSVSPFTATFVNFLRPSGSYIVRLVLAGTLNGVAQTPCERRETLNLPALNPIQNIQASINNVNLVPTGNNVNVACYNSVVQFSVTNPVAGETYLWNFDDQVGLDPATNSQPSPPRVFSNTTQPHTVTVTIKNRFGCTRSLTLQVTVPPQCFKGNVISNPSPAKICKGSLITISYKKDNLELGIDNCVTTDGTTTFTLMNQQAVIATNTTGVFTTTVAGFYWLKLSKAGLVPGSVCVYETPAPYISTQFVIPPTLTLSSPGTICLGEVAKIGINSSANAVGGTLSYVLDGSASVALTNPTTQLYLSDLAEDSHTLVVTATLDGCTTIATTSVFVIAPPSVVTIAPPVYVCVPTFQVTLTASASGTGTYLWSNGAAGPTITVFQGGAYEVTFINEGGCSSSAQADVFTPPNEYLWSFPAGNYQSCLSDFRRILGPNEAFYQYQWFKNNVVSESSISINTVVNPYHADGTTNMTSGSYRLKLTSGLNSCVATSEPMQLNVTPTACNQCVNFPIGGGGVTIVPNTNSLFCSFTVTLTLATPLPSSLAYITGMPQGSNAVMGPLTLNGNQLTFTIFPLSPFNGGTIDIQFSGNLPIGNPLDKCLTIYKNLTLPLCTPPAYKQINSSDVATTFLQESFTIAPNPAKEAVEISFTTQSKPTISIYDLNGRFVKEYNATTTTGTWQLPLNTMSSGVYLVVFKENGQVVEQKKLVVE